MTRHRIDRVPSALRGALLGSLLAGLLAAPAVPARAAVWSSDDVRLSPSTRLALTSPSRQTLVRLPGQRLYAVWYERTSPQTAIVLGAERSPEGIWTPELTALSLGDSLVRNPVVAAGPSGELHVAWEDLRDGAEEIFYRHRSVDGTWGPEIRLTESDGESQWPTLGVAPDGRLHLAWSDALSGNLEVYHCWKDPEGDFSPPRRLTFQDGDSREPNLVVDAGGDVHLVWQDVHLAPNTPDAPFNSEIYYRTLNAEGEPWSAVVRVSVALGLSRTPVLAIGPDNAIHVFWSDNRDSAGGGGTLFPFAIWYRRWLPGLGFGHEKRFVFSASDRLNPSVATTSNGTINVVWEDFSHGNSEIYYRQIRPDTGWDIQPTRLTTTPGPTRSPHLLADPDGTLHLLASDAGSGEEASIRYRLGRADTTVPVRLLDSRLVDDGNRLHLSWRTADEVDHAGFLVYAASALDADAAPLGALVTGGPDYDVVVDRNELGDARFLRLVALSRSGTLETMAVFAVEPGGGGDGPATLRLGLPHPNPVRTTVVVPFTLAAAASVRLELFDVAGRRVALAEPGFLPAGSHHVSWRLRGSGTAALPSGRYWVRLTAPGGRTHGRSLLLVD